MPLRRRVALTLAAIIAVAPALVAADAASAANPAPFIGITAYGTAFDDGQLGAMTVGVPYSDSVTRGAGYDEWTQLGTLPPGLTGIADGESFVISGTPTTPGDYTITLYSTGENFDSITFSMTVVDTPMASLRGLIDLQGTTLWNTGASHAVWFEYVNDSATTAAVNPRIAITLPDGVSIVGGDQQGDWVCSTSYPVVTCTSPTPIAPGDSGVPYIATLELASDYATSSFVLKNMASATNSAPVVHSQVVAVNLPEPVVAAPAPSPYSSVTLIGYAPNGQTGGTFSFQLLAGTTSQLIDATVGPDGVATYTGSIDSSFAGNYVTLSGTYLDEFAVITSTTESQYFYVYQQLNMAGSFYLNGALYTGGVKLYVYSDWSYDGSSGAFLQYPNLTGGSYNVTPPFDVSHSYYSWATLNDYGNLQTMYNDAGEYRPSSGYTTIGTRNFTNSMNFYWELAPSLTDVTIAQPRQNVVYADAVAATSNVALVYSISSGALPTGLFLNPATGAITGVASVLGENYSFSITATNSTNSLSATSGPITGTVLPEHIVPAWVDDTLAQFRLGSAVTDSVAADGDPTILYEVSDGALPAGVTLDAATGALGGTPTVLGELYDFELHAYNDWGGVYAEFSGEVLDALAAPVWTDNTIGELRVGVTLTDQVAASGVPAPDDYYISAGTLPGWASLDATTGAFTATPTNRDPYDFTITAYNSEGTVSQRFTGTPEAAWITPAFTDDTIAQLQGGVYLDDGVEAEGDGTIVYSAPLGDLPAWLTLNTANGLISGTTPLSEVGSPYSFTVTATSAHGSDTATITGVVAAAPTAVLTPNFAVGDIAAGAPFDYAVTGAGAATPFSVTVNSTPVVVASGSTNGAGAASGAAAIQSGITAGAHSIVLVSFASDGTARTTTVWFTVLRNGTIGAISLLGPLAYSEAALAGTGVDIELPVGAALLLVIVGGVLMTRRRSQQA